MTCITIFPTYSYRYIEHTWLDLITSTTYRVLFRANSQHDNILKLSWLVAAWLCDLRDRCADGPVNSSHFHVLFGPEPHVGPRAVRSWSASFMSRNLSLEPQKNKEHLAEAYGLCSWWRHPDGVSEFTSMFINGIPDFRSKGWRLSPFLSWYVTTRLCSFCDYNTYVENIVVRSIQTDTFCGRINVTFKR